MADIFGYKELTHSIKKVSLSAASVWYQCLVMSVGIKSGILGHYLLQKKIAYVACLLF
jgi:hypothetical protein